MSWCRWTTFRLLFFIVPTILLSACGDGGGDSTPDSSTPSYSVSTEAGTGGGISPDSISLKEGESAELIVIFDEGYGIESISGCGGTLSGNTYTTGPVTANCSVSASFVPQRTVIGMAGTGGTITPAANSVDYGSTTTLILTPDTGYEVAGVSGCDGTLFGNTYTTGPVIEDCAVSASFALQSFTVTGAAGSGGSITPASSRLNFGSITNLAVTPDDGYAIASVSGCGGTLSGNTYTTGAIAADCTVSASFIPLRTVTGTAGSGGSITPASTSVVQGGSATLMLTPNTGYEIDSVSGCGGALSGNTYTTSPITTDCTVSASFALQSFTVTATAGSGGSITPVNSSVDFGGTAAVIVTPDTGYEIDSVSGCGGTLSGYTYTTGAVTADCTVSASFALRSLTVTAVSGPGGNISPYSSSVDYDSTATLTVTPDTGYEIDSINAGSCPGILFGNTYTTGPVTVNCIISVYFALQTFTVTGTAGTGGTITPTDSSVDYGSATTLTLTPGTGYVIDSVSGCDGVLSGNTYTTGAITADCDVSASFALQNFTVTSTAGSGGSISPASSSVDYGNTATLTLAPDTGYEITDVSGCDGALSGNTYTTGTITADCEVSASFALQNFIVTSTAGSGGSITPANSSVDYGNTVTLTLAPDIGYEITGVSGCDGALSGNTYTTGAITADCDVSASFALQNFIVTSTAGSGGSITPASSSVDYGNTATLTLAPDTGYAIDSVSGCGGALSGDTYITGSITADCTVSASFIATYTITGSAGVGGSISPVSSTVKEGESASLTLTPDAGYAIADVSGCSGTLSGTTYTTGPVTADCTVSATYGVGYSVGGSVTGLNAGYEVVLSNNGSDALTLSDNAGFTFPNAIIDSGSYSVAVATQPAAQSCTVSNGSGIVSGSAVTDVSVSCVAVAPDAPTVSLSYGIKELQFGWSPVPGATYYKLSEDPDGVSGYSVLADSLTDTSVSHTITLYNRINARYIVEACNSAGCTGSSTVLMDDYLVDAIGYFKASYASTDVRFGSSVSLSSDGTVLAVGDSGESGGGVYLFTRSVDGWAQQAYLKASNAEESDSFGSSLSLSSDGSILAVGAFYEDSSATGVGGDQGNNDAMNSGAVYVFTYSDGAWSQQAYIKASNTGAGDYFGRSLSLSSNGTALAVAASHEDSCATGVDGDSSDNTALESGAVYVFTYSGSIWTQQAYLKAANTGASDYFGYSVSLSADASTLAVGAYYEDSGAVGVGGDPADNSVMNSGAVYMFSYDGSAWSQQAYIKASNTETYDYFGGSVSLSSDGNTLAVGAGGEDSSATGVNGDQSDNSASASGAVYLFSRSADTWSQQAYLKTSAAGGGDNFGDVVSLAADGTVLAVSAGLESSSAVGVNGDASDNSATISGAAYLFTYGAMGWSQKAYLKASNTDASDRFGKDSLSLSSDGNTLAIGARGEDSSAIGIDGDQSDNSMLWSGAVYLY